MNIEKWEDKIIIYLEGDLDASAKDEILLAAAKDPEINTLWISYKSIYTNLAEMESAELCVTSKMKFDTFLQGEIDKQASPKKKESQLVSMSSWKKLMTIAAITVGVLFIWNHQKQDRELNESLASVHQQLEQMVESNSPTEKIKAIRVSYDNQSIKSDVKTKQLLVNVLKNDPSSNVRLAAVEALEKYTDDDKIREALIKALMAEQDGFVKLALVKTLSKQFNTTVANTFEEIANDKTNEKFLREEVEKELFRYNQIES